MQRCLVAVTFFCAAVATAQVPTVLGYQGRLLDSAGTPATGVATVKFALFGQAAGGAELWSETQSLGLSNGQYSTFLGTATPSGCAGAGCTGVPTSVFDGADRYLELTVNGSLLSPRQRVGSVAYAVRARSLSGGAVDATSLSINGVPLVDGTGRLTGSALSVGAPFSLDAGVLALTGCSAAGSALVWNGAVWACGAGGAAGTAGGDLGGSYPSPSVNRLRGVNVSATAPTSGQVLTFNGTDWAPTAMGFAADGGLTVSPVGQLSLQACPAGAALVSTGSGWACRRLFIDTPTTLTVGASGAFATLPAALDSLKGVTLTALVTVSLQAGTYTMGAPVQVDHPNGTLIAIVGDEATPANVVLNFGTNSGFIIDRAHLGLISGVTIQGTGSGSGSGVYAQHGATVKLSSSVRVAGFTYGVRADSGANVQAQNTRVAGAGSIAYLSANGASLIAAGAAVTGSTSYGFYAQYGAFIDATAASSTGANVGYAATHHASITAQGATVTPSGSGSYGFLTTQHSYINAYGAAVSGGTFGTVAGGVSFIDARTSSVSSATPYNPPGNAAGNFGSYAEQ